MLYNTVLVNEHFTSFTNDPICEEFLCTFSVHVQFCFCECLKQVCDCIFIEKRWKSQVKCKFSADINIKKHKKLCYVKKYKKKMSMHRWLSFCLSRKKTYSFFLVNFFPNIFREIMFDSPSKVNHIVSDFIGYIRFLFSFRCLYITTSCTFLTKLIVGYVGC